MLEGESSVILTNHAILVYYHHVSFFYVFELFLQLVDVLLFGRLHLPHYFFLGVQFTVQILCFRKCFIHLMLILQTLLIQQLHLLLRGYKLYFTSFYS